MRRALAALVILIGAALTFMSGEPASAEQASPLTAVEADLRKTFPNVRVMSSAELAAIESSGAPIVLLDARSAQEFAVSRIEGARRVDPAMSAAQFEKTFGGELKGRKVVVYCAVGGRSSTLASRIDRAADTAGAAGVYSLEGGIFRWHNEKRPLVGPAGATDEVHPFSANAARLIERQDGIAYQPGASKAGKAE